MINGHHMKPVFKVIIATMCNSVIIIVWSRGFKSKRIVNHLQEINHILHFVTLRVVGKIILFRELA
uniref:Putative ovule protein n=1 Tax=Solanum chacoense TaxID=4108 RepID=A0A0V0HLJ1_SOLCH